LGWRRLCRRFYMVRPQQKLVVRLTNKPLIINAA